MPNYSLVANSTFQPFTYQELMMPVERQNQYFEKLAEEYDKMSSQADVLEAMGSSDLDKNSGTYNRYKAYSDNLRKERDNLYANGLNMDSRQRLSDLRRMYNTEIVPIQNAWQKREQEADMQMKARLQNPSLMFTRDARNSTLDTYLSNPTGGYGVINGANITAQMAGMASNLAKQVREGRRENIDDYTFNYIQQHGLDANIIRNWRNNPTLSRMFEQVMQANGVTPEALNGNVNAQGIIDKSTGYAEMGMWNAIGEDRSQIVNDFKKREDYKYAQELDKMYRQHDLERDDAILKAQLAGKGNGNGLDAENPTGDLFSQQQGTLPIAVADKNIDNAVQKSASAFGWSQSDKTQSGYYPGRVTVKTSGIAPGTKLSYIPDLRISMFDNNGNVKRWDKFRQDAIGEANKAYRARYKTSMPNAERRKLADAIQKQFQNAVESANSLGLDTKKGYTSQDLVNALNKQKASGSAGYINGYHWNHKNSDWNPTAQNLNVREIKKVNHEGRFTFDSKAHTLSDLLDTSANADINTGKGDVHAFISGQDGQEGVIFTVGKRQFFAHKDAFASNRYGARAFDLIKAADRNIEEAGKIESTDPNEAYTLKQEASNWTSQALSLLDLGFATNNDTPKNKTVAVSTAK